MIFDLSFLLPVLVFSIASSITPGPNMIMVMASSTNYGYVHTLPHIFGISLDFPLMLITLGLGLDGIFATNLWVHDILKYLCLPMLVWMAWKIATANVHAPHQGEKIQPDPDSKRPFKVHEAMLFQWFNPKA